VQLELEGGTSISEFPLTTLPLGPVNLPLAGGAYLRFLPPALFRWGLARLEAAASALILYVHPWEIDPDQPRQPVRWWTRINHYHNLHRTEGRLRGLLERFQFASVGEVLGRLESAGQLAPYRLPS
jgi:hypothetical protein